MHRFKLKFSPDKVDTMVVQAIALLDDLDKEINIYSMRVKVNTVFSHLMLCCESGLIVLFCRSGMVGISQKWAKLLQTILHMQKLFKKWVCCSLQELNTCPDSSIFRFSN